MIEETHNQGINVLSLFDGMSCGRIALERAGFEVENYFASEIDEAAIAVAKHNYPGTKHVGDVTLLTSSSLPKIDLLIGGSPCFRKGTKIETEQGYKSIEDVEVGDLVLTHNNQFKKVLKIGGKLSNEGLLLKAQGVPPIETTKEHPFYVRTWDRKGVVSEPYWKAASKITKQDYIAVQLNTKSENPLGLTEDECLVLGRYIADGHTRKDYRGSEGRSNDRHWQLIISVGKNKVQEFTCKYKLHHSLYPHTTSVSRAVFSSKRLVQIAEEHCGIGAHDKQFSAMLMNLPVKLLERVLEGYIDGDGCSKDGFYKATTVSRTLALSLSKVVSKVYNTGTTIHFFQRPEKYVIQGRIVNQSSTFTVSFKKEKTGREKYKMLGNTLWYPVKSVTQLDDTSLVYNLEVDCDNSYTADNAVVHNCQSISNLGDGTGLDGKSGLFFHYLRLLKETQPKYFLLENVVGNKKAIAQITDLMQVEPVLFNSNLVSAQNRKRLYWTNIKFDLPEDKNIYLKDVLDEQPSSSSIVTAGRLKWLLSDKGRATLQKKYAVLDPEKANCLTARSDASWNCNYVTRNGVITKLSCEEYEKLQTVPIGYTSIAKSSERYKMLGNGWTVDVIAHILKHMEFN